MIRSSFGMKLESAFKKVVFPEGFHQFFQIVDRFPGDRAPFDQLLHGDGMVGKPPDCDSGSVDRNRIHDNVHACAVLQTGVDNRDSLIRHTVGERDNALDDILEFFL